MGLRTDLKLQSNDFTNASTVFFVAYLIAELPNSMFWMLVADAHLLIHQRLHPQQSAGC